MSEQPKQAKEPEKNQNDEKAKEEQKKSDEEKTKEELIIEVKNLRSEIEKIKE